MRRLLPFLLIIILVCACGNDETTPQPEPEPAAHEQSGLKPVIRWQEVSARFRMLVGETLTLVPDCEYLDETTTYRWILDNQVVSTTSSYTFTPEQAGEFFISLTVSNRYGQTTDEAKVTVTEPENTELPAIPEYSCFQWRFPWTEINIAQGRTIKVKAYVFTAADNAQYSWTLDGLPVDGMADEPAYVFEGTQQGTHTLTITMTDGSTTLTQDLSITVCPPAGTYRRNVTGQAMVSKVYELMPAPGHQVNGFIIVGDSYPEGCSHEQACAIALEHFLKKWSVSLGSQGGYIIAGFDHSVGNSGSGYDLCIQGNPYDYQSEPGIVWVSQDDNGDGLPNDQWFELAGSEYGSSRSTPEYAIIYYRPENKKSATAWRDCLGATGYVPYMSYWNSHDFYWQDWVEGSEHTYFSTRLQDRSSYVNGVSTIPPYSWGYADNLGADFMEGTEGIMNHFRIANARTWDGKPAELEYIDFVKVQTAQTGSTPNLGDISTEIYYIGAVK